MGSEILEQVYEHLRGVAEEARAAALARDMAGFRAAVGRFSAFSDETTAYTAAIMPVEAAGVPCEWVCDKASAANSRLLYIHGGSWMSGSPAEYRALTARIAKATGCSVLAIDYRLAPEDPFPAGLEDCVAAYKWMLENGPSGAAPTERVFIAGDSAGGNLTFATLLKLRDESGRLPDGAIPISPATDFTASGESTKTRADVDPIIDAATAGTTGKPYFRDHDVKNPLLSPLFGDLAGLPPLLVQVGDAETLLDDSVRIAKKAEEASVDVRLEVYPEMPHVWHVFAPVLPESLEAIEHIGEFVRSLGTSTS